MVSTATSRAVDRSVNKIDNKAAAPEAERLELWREQANSLNLSYQIFCLLSNMHDNS